MINSLMYAFSSFGAISSISLDSFSSVRNSLSKATLCSVFFFVFSFSWSSINCSTETMSANLETMIDSGEAAKVVNIPTLGSRAERRENRYHFFFTSEKYRMTNHRPRTIFFTSEKNLCIDQSDCFWVLTDHFYLTALFRINLSTRIINGNTVTSGNTCVNHPGDLGAVYLGGTMVKIVPS